MTEEIHENHTIDSGKVIEKEREHLNINKEDKTIGLAISGGGIRSASFGLGVLQGLVAYNQLEKVHYMSTVSGGGYIGSALTWALNRVKGAGTKKENFPLGSKKPSKAKKEFLPNETEQNENRLLNYIRQHASYLAPTKALDMVSFVAVVLRGMLMSLFVYLAIFTVFETITVKFFSFLATGFIGQFTIFCFNLIGIKLSHTSIGILFIFVLVGVLMMAILGFLFSLSTYLKNEKLKQSRYTGFIKGQITLGKIFKIMLVCLILGSVPLVKRYLVELGEFLSTISVSSVSGILVGIWQYVKARKNEGNTKQSTIVIYIGAFLFFYSLILTGYFIATNFFLNAHDNEFNVRFGSLLVLIIITFIFGYFVNLNFLGPHYIWRNRLMEAFMPEPSAVKLNKWKAAVSANTALMKDMCSNKELKLDKTDEVIYQNPKPYHIINTNVILSNSETIEYSGRGGDNFIISPLYCGSAATGWKTTKTYQQKSTGGITLASAMATSAAALNPNAGVSGEGITRNVIVSNLLSVLNLRLGYWAQNPSKKDGYSSPNFFSPGLVTEIFRNGFTEKHNNLLLSDGGHYENIGLYELIRRKLNLIIVSDGGADPAFNFDDLSNAIEKVRVDFGAHIIFRNDCGIDGILPNSLNENLFQQKYELAQRGFAMADIYYNDETVGHLVYIKLANIKGLPTDLYSYKGIHPAFPHQPTSDQFFDEKQFEAYRELGYHITKQMFESEFGKEIFNIETL